MNAVRPSPAAKTRIYTRTRLRLLCLGLLLGLGMLLLAGCPKGIMPPAYKGADPAPVWKRFVEEARAQTKANQAKAFTLTAGLHYAGPKNSSRVNIRFWGNLGAASRLDLQTSMGQSLGYWREDNQEFTAFIPDKKTAFVHTDGKLGMAGFGIALPFTLRELGLLLNGRWSGLAPETYVSARAAPGKGFSYLLAKGGEEYTLLLDAEGAPRSMTTAGAAPWMLEFSDFDTTAPGPKLPKKIVMTRDPGEKAVLIIKKLEQMPDLWPDNNLHLDLPPDTRVQIMDNSSAIGTAEPDHG